MGSDAFPFPAAKIRAKRTPEEEFEIELTFYHPPGELDNGHDLEVEGLQELLQIICSNYGPKNASDDMQVPPDWLRDQILAALAQRRPSAVDQPKKESKGDWTPEPCG